MMNKSKMKRFLILSLAAFAFVLFSGNLSETKAQCAGNDPFCKPTRATPKQPKPNNPTTNNPTNNPTGNQTNTPTTKPVPVKPQIMIVPAPSAEQRIAYYKRLREDAALRGDEIPKVTSVLLIDEMSVTGIFRTPRGFAAMVEAKPISLSYTIYPGDKFFDGQLVAIEENRLVFRRITKMSNNKFVTSVENKTLRQYSDQEVVQGTAPVTAQSQTQTQTQTQTSQTETGTTNTTGTTTTTTQSDIVISPLDEMNRQQQTEQQETKPTTKPTKKPRVSKKGK